MTKSLSDRAEVRAEVLPTPRYLGPGYKPEVGKHFYVKGQIVNIFSFVGNMFSVTTTQLCFCGAKTARDNM